MKQRRILLIALVLIAIGGTAAAAALQLGKLDLQKESELQYEPDPPPPPAKPGTSMGSAGPPVYERFAMLGQHLNEHSGFESSAYLYSKENAREPAGFDSICPLHRYSMDGELLWTAEVGYCVDLLELRNGNVFVGGRHRAWLLDSSGRVLHSEVLEDDPDMFSMMHEASDGTILTTRNRSWVYGFSPQGKLLWRHQVEHQSIRSLTQASTGEIVFNGHGNVTALSPTGKLLWEKQLAELSEINMRGDRVIAETSTELVCLAAADGAELWRASMPGFTNTETYVQCEVTADGRCYFWEFQGALLALDGAGSVLWEYREVAQRNGRSWGIWDVKLDSAGNVYIINNNQLISIDPAGTERWRVDGAGDFLSHMRIAGPYVIADSETHPSDAEVEAMIREWEKATGNNYEEWLKKLDELEPIHEDSPPDEECYHGEWEQGPSYPPSHEHIYWLDSSSGHMVYDLSQMPTQLYYKLRNDGTTTWDEPLPEWGFEPEVKEGAGQTSVSPAEDKPIAIPSVPHQFVHVHRPSP